MRVSALNFKEEFDMSVSNLGKILTIRVFGLENGVTIFEKTIEVGNEKNNEKIVEHLRSRVFEGDLLYAMVYKYLINFTSVNPEGKSPMEVMDIIIEKLSSTVE